MQARVRNHLAGLSVTLSYPATREDHVRQRGILEKAIPGVLPSDWSKSLIAPFGCHASGYYQPALVVPHEHTKIRSRAKVLVKACLRELGVVVIAESQPLPGQVR